MKPTAAHLVTLIAGLFLLCLFAAPAAVAQAVDFTANGFIEALVAQGLKTPTNMAIAPDGRIFILEQASVSLPNGTQEGRGYVRVVKNGALLPTPFVTINNIDLRGEHGLVGIAFDPGFASNGYVYLFYTLPKTDTVASHNEVWRYTANPSNRDVALSGSGIRVIQFPSIINTVHIGGSMHFNPADGKLYIAIGDDLTGADRAQNINDFRGRFMRYTINSDGTFSAPTDNPWYGTADDEISKGTWAMGFRNPFQFAIQPGTGRIFANDVGQETYEEIDNLQKGKHYGWKFCEGPCSPANPAYTNPILYYLHGKTANNEGCAIIGSAFYNPTTVTFPSQYVGKYFFSDYCNNWIRYIDPANPGQSTLFATKTYNNMVALAVAADGSMYYLARGISASDGRLLKINYDPESVPKINNPPQPQTVIAGGTATFTCSATGAGPITYAWQRQAPGAADYVYINGATSTSYTTPVTTNADNGARYRCKATNSFGSSFSAGALLTVATNNPPEVTVNVLINGSAARQTWLLGDTISFTINAVDALDGTIPNDSITWSVDLHHQPPLSGTHIHPILPVTSGTNTGSFDIADEAHDRAHLWYQINVHAVDEHGAATDVVKIIESSLIGPVYNTSTTSTRPILSWQPIPGATGYQVYFGQTDTPTTYYTVTSGAIHRLTLPDTLIATQTYYWYVRALFSGGESAGTDTWRFQVVSAANGAPLRNFVVSPQPTLSWTRIVFATGYRVQISKSTAFNAATIVYESTVMDDTTLEHTVTTPLAEGVYYWRVAALRANGSTAYFSPAQAITVKLD